jgi:hypothetical protein
VIHLGVFLPDLAIIDAEWHCWGFAATLKPRQIRVRITTSLLATVFAIMVAFGNVFAGGHKKSKMEWSAEIGQSQVTIKHEGKTVSVVRSGLPNVEETRFLEQDGRKMLAVKSRGEHGPALLQLFDVQTGALKDKVLAFAVKGGKPAWAAPWKE